MQSIQSTSRLQDQYEYVTQPRPTAKNSTDDAKGVRVKSHAGSGPKQESKEEPSGADAEARKTQYREPRVAHGRSVWGSPASSAAPRIPPPRPPSNSRRPTRPAGQPEEAAVCLRRPLDGGRRAQARHERVKPLLGAAEDGVAEPGAHGGALGAVRRR